MEAVELEVKIKIGDTFIEEQQKVVQGPAYNNLSEKMKGYLWNEYGIDEVRWPKIDQRE